MLTFTYPASFRKDKACRVLVQFPDFPHASTDGATVAEAMEEGIDCLGSAIAFALADKMDIPRPSALKRGQRIIPVPLWVAPKLALYWRMRELGINNSQLAPQTRREGNRGALDAASGPRHQNREAAGGFGDFRTDSRDGS